MLKPIPSKILTHCIVVKVPGEIDSFGEVAYVETALNKVHCQIVHQWRRGKDNRDVLFTGVLFWDKQLSTPFSWADADMMSRANNSPIKIEYDGKEYTAETIDYLVDDEGGIHHIEIGLI